MKKIILTNILIFLSLLIVVEVVSYFILKEKKIETSFLIDTVENSEKLQLEDAKNYTGKFQFSGLDVNLGYIQNPNEIDSLVSNAMIDKKVIPGFVKHGDEHNDTSIIRIVTLGGSTTDGTLNKYSWPEDLYNLLDKKKYVVYNGGVGGFTSSQETFKLIRDVLQIKPHIVIDLSGINDIVMIHSTYNHPYANHYQEYLFKILSVTNNDPSPVLTSTFKLIKKIRKKIFNLNDDEKPKYVSYGNINNDEKPRVWYQNVNIMYAISKQFNFKYYCFLQPTIGIGNYKATKHEVNRWKGTFSPNYYSEVKDFYTKALKLSSRDKFCIDFTSIFDNDKNMYTDMRHQNHKGTKKIARLIYNQIFN
jgi:lysophospholipase L1-like esterase